MVLRDFAEATTDRDCNLYCFSMDLRDSGEAITDRVCNLTCFSMVLRDSAEATTDRICNFYCFSIVSNLYAQNAHCDTVRRQEQTQHRKRRHGGH